MEMGGLELTVDGFLDVVLAKLNTLRENTCLLIIVLLIRVFVSFVVSDVSIFVGFYVK